tara:strand:+ start:6380 stop:6940 length:561 start_codon:yes stop_codon:yes gene_type:complete
MLFTSISVGKDMPELVNEGHAAGKQGNYTLEYKDYLAAAKAGDAQAQSNLGALYLQGEGVPIDYNKALFWLRKSLAQHNKSAYNNLAYVYLFGKGVKKDVVKAIDLYQQGAKYGDLNSCQRLGFIYFQGQIVKRNLEQAYLYFTLAAEKNDRTSASMLVVLSKQMTPQQIQEANKLVANYKTTAQG